MTLTIEFEVVDLRERSRAVRSWKNERGEIQTEREPLGWFLSLQTFDGPVLSFGVGAERPDFEVGEEVEVIVRKRPPRGGA